MGERGPAPKPTALRVLEGNRAKRPLRREPKPRLGAPECPKELQGEARAEWQRVVPDLDQIGLLARADRAILISYCQTWSALIDAQREMELDFGRHAILVWAKLNERLLAHIRELGLSPAARSRLGTVPDKQDDDSLGGLLH